MTKALRTLGLAAMMAAAAMTAGCTQLRSHQGYLIDADLVNSVQPGVDNRASVVQTLGKPSFASQFNNGDWYYVARDSRNLAFRNPRPSEQVTLKISFDQRGTVSSITRMGMAQVAAVNPYGKTTPTLGRKRSFFQELFGNIGAVGTTGAGTGGGNGRDQP
ncbi:outer membrane protein assembly factor BamE [uncultured Sphingomonas sp.]|uniref:outer membrane protein assembly factor BamE n=1 Tax=uncultured Sphingomonas sp. TaxID=158754 RepID=UPI0035C96031